MAKAPVVAKKKNVNPRGEEIKEYPKLVRINEKKKVLVQSAEEEAALGLEAPKPQGNQAKW